MVLKYHLTEDGCNPHILIAAETSDAELRKLTTAALRCELQQVWNPFDPKQKDFVDRLVEADVANRPLYLLHELQYTSAAIFANPELGGAKKLRFRWRFRWSFVRFDCFSGMKKSKTKLFSKLFSLDR